MTLEARSVSVPSLGLVKMEDTRKRNTVPDADDALPPPKRQATLVNGKKGEDFADWDPNMEEFRKDAIFRSFKQLKKDKTELESQVAELDEKSKFHDDHLRIIDAWLSQLLDELRNTSFDTYIDPSTALSTLTTLPTAENEKFQAHLSAHASTIKLAITELFGRIPAPPPDAQRLQRKLNEILATQKDHTVELQRLAAEKEKLNDRLEDSTLRYMMAEKRLERNKSQIYQKVFQIGEHAPGAQPAAKPRSEPDVEDTNGAIKAVVLDENMEAERRAAVAAADKRKEQLAQMEDENKKLMEQVTTLNTRLASLSDDDYSKTDLFKALKSQHEDVIRRINNLEATNVELREEAQKLQAERTAYRLKVEEDSRTAVTEAESELAKAEADLARIRTSRDEYSAELNIRKQTLEQSKASIDQMKELNASSEGRIAALESEIERLKVRAGDLKVEGSEDLSSLSLEELREKIARLEKENSLIGHELPAMEAAWRKAQAIGKKNVAEISSMEEHVSRLSAEKAKANEKYFAAMKSKEARDAETRTLRMQNAKSSEIVTQLKESESQAKSMLTQMERQLSEAKEAQAVLASQVRTLQQKVTDYTISSEGLTTQIVELKKILSVKDNDKAESDHARREVEIKLEETKAKLAETAKRNEELKQKAKGKMTEADEMLRRIAYCHLCRTNFKDAIITVCNHVFCMDCAVKQIKLRSRKCPTCGKPFGENDIAKINLLTH
ncbi:putative histone ubiquitinationc protein [Rhizodiscina lignyota]|uniref:E3 ubiquitin protein ligase n=1 Tax=Rhizodiscina lignyota TaxID=1504668 RepID=A0A9P4I8C2_9PEZI|nr:putative histone ubiquitinationc protein [Rhizodiscina lignyota]